MAILVYIFVIYYEAVKAIKLRLSAFSYLSVNFLVKIPVVPLCLICGSEISHM